MSSRRGIVPGVVAITGGARGIGLASAKAFAARGARVAIGDVDTDLVRDSVRQLPGTGHAHPLDVTDTDSFTEFLDETESELGEIDVLVNNAGVMLTGEFITERAICAERMLEINLAGAITGAKLVGSRFVARGRRGHIVNVASMAGVAGFPGVVTYCATKFGVVGLTRALRAELGPAGVGASAILPGIVHTDLSAGLTLSPLLERFGSCEPDDVALSVVNAVAHDRAITYTPARLGIALRALTALPEPVQRKINRALNASRLYLDADPATRDSYHQRARM